MDYGSECEILPSSIYTIHWVYIVTFMVVQDVFFYYKLTGIATGCAVLYSQWEIQYLKLYKIDAIVNVFIKKSESVFISAKEPFQLVTG